MVAAALCAGRSFPSAAQSISAAEARRGVIEGSVRDPFGKPVSGAKVRLERNGEPGAMEATTSPNGGFAFQSARSGTYIVSAQKEDLRTVRLRVIVDSAGSLTLADGAGAIVLKLAKDHDTDAKTALPGREMEFSDSPSFTIAAVTDWTAAGGHGSDAILRTSESLTRDAVNLKGSNEKADASASPATTEREAALRTALAAAPASYEANTQIGEFYLEEGRYKDAIPFFEAAQRVNPANYANGYHLALALQGAGENVHARKLVRDLAAGQKTADLFRLAGVLDEKLGDPVAAVNELEQAVHEEGSEENYYLWGSELLLHRAIWQAKDVFTAGAMRYPSSARMLTALGATLFACSLYDDAAQRLCEAADLNPEAEEPYLFLGKAELASPDPLRCSEDKLAEFVKRHPENPLASYYDGMAIWKQSGRSNDPQVLGQVETRLNRAVALDPKCADAYLQLGNVSASRHDNEEAIAFFTKAIEANPQLAEAHYRLGMAYDRIGERDKAKREFQLHEELDKEQASEVERQRREVKQFLVKRNSADTSNP
jgi:tetratricopeptide (TPR) repeat protein